MKKKIFVFKLSKQLIISISILAFLFLSTLTVILYGRGYIEFYNGKPAFSGTGILAAKSTPDGAEVQINGHLTTATNNNINLIPGDYDVTISKDGYFPWKKKVTIEKEYVSNVDALLLPIYPKLENSTLTGVFNPIIDPSLTKIAYTFSSSDSAQTAQLKNGIYILDMSGGSILTLGGNTTQIATDNFDEFSRAALSWSPDGKNLLASVSANRKASSIYLLQTNSLNQNPQDVTETISDLQSQWDKGQQLKQASLLDALRSKKLEQIAKDNFDIKAWSADETKILYIASQSATIPQIIDPQLRGTDSTPETRTIQPNSIYVYDIKEDKNFSITGNGNDFGNIYQLAWLPDSKHLVYVHDKKIDIMDYDGANRTTIYAGPFIGNYAFPWPDGSKIAILTNLGNPDIEPHLYTIGLK